MRHFLIKNAYVFQEFQRINQKLIAHDEQLEKVFQAMENKELPRQGIFFNGQVFDAFVYISQLIKTAQKRIVLIDNYVDESTLQLFSDKNSEVSVNIYTKNINHIPSLRPLRGIFAAFAWNLCGLCVEFFFAPR